MCPEKFESVVPQHVWYDEVSYVAASNVYLLKMRHTAVAGCNGNVLKLNVHVVLGCQESVIVPPICAIYESRTLK
jgi:hypothetical protein